MHSFQGHIFKKKDHFILFPYLLFQFKIRNVHGGFVEIDARFRREDNPLKTRKLYEKKHKTNIKKTTQHKQHSLA